MSKKVIKSNIAAEVVMYIKPKYPKDLNQEKLKEDITLQIQGEAVEIDESNDLVALLITLNIAYKFCPELIFKSQDGKKYTIFNHQTTPVLGIDNVIEGMSVKSSKKFKKTTNLEINIEEIYNSIAEKEEKNKIEKCLKEVEKKLKQAKTITLIGKKPALVFLLVQYFYSGVAKEVFYKKDINSKRVRIK